MENKELNLRHVLHTIFVFQFPGEKPFKCEICQSSFRTRKYFNEHKQIHLEVKNHECSLCGMKFKQASGVRNHKRKVHGKRVTSKRIQNDKSDL